jgi:hypothetical protein
MNPDIIMRTCLSSIIFLLLSALALAQSADQQPYVLPRVGTSLDRNDIAYFECFPDLRANERLSSDAVKVEVFHVGADSVDFVIYDNRVRSGEPIERIRLPESSARALGRYLQHFEDFRDELHPWEFPKSVYVTEELRAGAQLLIDENILDVYWPRWSRDGSATLLDISLTNGSQFQAYALGVTTERLMLWTGGPDFDAAQYERFLRVVEHHDVARIDLNEIDRSSGGLVGLFLCSTLFSAAAIGTSNDVSTYTRGIDDEVMRTMATAFGMALGSVGFLICPENERSLFYSQEEGESFADALLYFAIDSPFGISPELRTLVPLRKNEKLVTSPEARVPYVRGLRRHMDTTRHTWNIGVEELWVRVTDLSGMRWGAMLGYEYFLWGSIASKYALTLQVPLAIGVEYLSLAAWTTLRLDRLEVFAGIRALQQPEKMHFTRQSEEVGGYSSTFESVYYNRPEQLPDYLYGEFGLGFRILDHMRIRMHFLTQMTPSVTIHDSWSGPKYTGDPANRETFHRDREGNYIRAFGISMQLRL